MRNGGETHTVGATIGALDARGLDGVRWWAGWRPLVTIGGANFAGIALGNAVAVPADVLFGDGLLAMAGLAVSGFVCGVVAWLAGTRTVNDRYPAILDAFVEETRADAVASLDVDESRVESLVGGDGTSPLVKASERSDVTHLIVDDGNVRAYRAGLDLVSREVLYDHRVTEVTLDRVREASWDGSSLVLATVDGTTHRFASDERPDAALALIENGVPTGR